MSSPEYGVGVAIAIDNDGLHYVINNAGIIYRSDAALSDWTIVPSEVPVKDINIGPAETDSVWVIGKLQGTPYR